MILVTGATGFVGTHLLIKLLQEKQHVRALYRNKEKIEYCKKICAAYLDNEALKSFDAIEWIQASINDIAQLTIALHEITHVYHCAALISFDPADQKKSRKVNIEGTANIVNLCLVQRVKKLCYVSSIATIGENPSLETYNENTLWNSEANHSIYAITKYGAEMEVWRGTQEGLNVIIVNPGIILGSGFYDTGSGSIFKEIWKGMPYFTSGSSGFIGVRDVVNIMFQLMKSHVKNERYILVSDNYSFKKVFSDIAVEFGKKPPNKKVKPYLLKTVYYAQLLGNYIFNIKRSVFKSTIQAAFSHSIYANDKIKDTLKYEFTPLSVVIKDAVKHFEANYSSKRK